MENVEADVDETIDTSGDTVDDCSIDDDVTLEEYVCSK